MLEMMDIISCLFFKQKTAYEMRISDWSSDVCSSDLRGRSRQHRRPADGRAEDRHFRSCRPYRHRPRPLCGRLDAEDPAEDRCAAPFLQGRPSAECPDAEDDQGRL